VFPKQGKLVAAILLAWGMSAPAVSAAARKDGEPLPPGVLARFGAAPWRDAGYVLSVAFAPDGKTLATCGQRLCVWDVATGKKIRQVEIPGDNDIQRHVAFSRDGKLLAACLNDTLTVWEAASWKPLWSIKAAKGGFSHLSLSPDGKMVAATSHDGRRGHIHFWDAAAGKELGQVAQNEEGAVNALAFSPRGDTLAAVYWVSQSGNQHLLRIYDAASRKPLRTFRIWTQFLVGKMSVTWFQDGQSLLIGGSQVVRMDTNNGRELKWTTELYGYETTAAFSPDGKTVALGRFESVVLCDATTGKELRRFTGVSAAGIGVRDVAFSPDGKRLAVGVHTGYRPLFLLDLATGTELPQFGDGHGGPVKQLAFTTGGRTLVSVGNDHSVRVWDAATGKLRRLLPFTTEYIHNLSPDGRMTLTVRSAEMPGRRTEELVLRSTLDDRTAQRIPAPFLSLEYRFSPDSKYLIGWRDKDILVLEVATQKTLRRFTQEELITDAILAPDGQTLATGPVVIVDPNAEEDQERKVKTRLWDMATGKERLQVTGRAFAFSPDSRLLALRNADYLLVLVEAATGREVRHFTAIRGATYAYFSPDGRTIATGQADGTICCWEIATGKEWRRYTLQSQATALAFRPDGRVLAAGCLDGTLATWDLTGPPPTRPKDGKLKAQELDALWTDLADTDPARAWRAVWALAAAEEQAVPFLAQRLKPASELEGQRMRQWITDLDSKEFAVRQKATQALENLGKSAEPALQAAAHGKLSLETRRRIEQLLAKLARATPAREELQQLRAVASLEHIGTAAARQVLAGLTKGRTDALLTQDARASLERLDKRARTHD
jgi:WD40 repeat protein